MPSNTSKHEVWHFFLLLWVIFALLDPDPIRIRIRILNPGSFSFGLSMANIIYGLSLLSCFIFNCLLELLDGVLFALYFGVSFSLHILYFCCPLTSSFTPWFLASMRSWKPPITNPCGDSLSKHIPMVRMRFDLICQQDFVPILPLISMVGYFGNVF